MIIFRFNSKLSLICLLGALFTPQMLFAQTYGQAMTPIEIYARCYAKLVGEPLPANDSNRALVTAGTKTAVVACMELFDSAMWEAGTSALDAPETKPVALKIIRTLHNFHRTWFQSRAFGSIDGNGNEAATSVVIDSEEVPLYVTRAALQRTLKYESIFKTQNGLSGLRYRPNRTETNEFDAQNVIRHACNTNQCMPYGKESYMPISYRDPSIPGTEPELTRYKAVIIPDDQLVQVGSLYGVRNPDPIQIPYVAAGTVHAEATTAFRTELSAHLSQNNRNVNLREHAGGGVLGSAAFLLGNTNVTDGRVPFGEILNHRRLASRVYQDLLCHENPPLLITDIPDSALVTGGEPFRLSKTCMQCHYSFDPFADGYRHLFFITSSLPPIFKRNESGHAMSLMRKIPIKAGSAVYNMQTPTGVWRFRPLLTEPTTPVVNLTFSSLQQAGDLLAGQNDPYLCAAKRYYKFLTGVQVPLLAIPSTEVGAEAQLTRAHQQLVKNYAQVLKTNTVRELFRQIIISSEFRTRNYKAVTAGGQ